MPFLRALLLLTLALAPAASLCATYPPAAGATARAGEPHPTAQPLPVETIAAVLEDANRDTIPDRMSQRVHIRGTVTVPTGALRRQGLHVFLQDATGGMALYNRRFAGSLAEGDVVEAWGQVQLYRGAPQLEDVRVEVVARGPSPAPLVMGAAQTSDRTYQGRLIRTQGQVGTLSLDSYGIVNLTGDDGASLTLFVPEPMVSRFDWKHFPKGTRVSATGIMSIHKPSWPYNAGYQLVVYRPADLKVLEPPPPAWHRWLLTAIAAGTCLLGLGLLGLYVMRQRQRARQSELQALSALSSALAAPDLGEQQLARRACEILTAYRITEAAIAQIYDAEGCLRQVAVATADPSLEPALQNTGPLCPTDPGGEAHGRQIEAKVAATGLGLMAIYPLPASSGTIGFLIALSPRRRRPSRMQERTLLAAVKLLAMALENGRIQTRAREEQRELQQLVMSDELT